MDRVLEKAARFVGGSAATIFWWDGIRNAGNSYYNFGTDGRYERLYFDKYIKFDPLSAAYFLLDVGEVTSNSMLIPPAEFFETRFYREWVQPQGWIDNVFAVLERSATSIGVFAAFRHERDGLADDNARRHLRLIAPHLRRAVLIGKVIDLKTGEAATFANMLDTFNAGIFLVDAAGRIVHENPAGRSILAAGDILRSAAGRLVARDPQVNEILHDAFKSAERGDAAIGAQGIAVPLIALDGERHVAHLLNLNSEQVAGANTTFSAPSLAVVGNSVAIAAQGPNNSLMFYWHKIGTSHWNPEQVAGANTTFSAPSLAKIGNASAIAAQGPTNSLMFNWQKIDTTQWNSEQVAGRGTTFSAPSLAQVGNASAITAQGPKDQLMFYWQTIDTAPWHGSALVGTGTVTTPAIAQIGNSTVIVAVDANANLYYYWQTIDTKQWHPEQAGTVDDKQVTPSVAQVGNSSAIAVPLSDATGAITLFWQKIDTTPWTAERLPDSVNPVLGLQVLQISN